MSVLRESALERKSRTYVLALGGEFLKVKGAKGWPDRIIILPNGVVLFCEFKRHKKKPDPLQRHILNKICKLGANAFYVDNYTRFMNNVHFHCQRKVGS